MRIGIRGRLSAAAVWLACANPAGAEEPLAFSTAVRTSRCGRTGWCGRHRPPDWSLTPRDVTRFSRPHRRLAAGRRRLAAAVCDTCLGQVHTLDQIEGAAITVECADIDVGFTRLDAAGGSAAGEIGIDQGADILVPLPTLD